MTKRGERKMDYAEIMRLHGQKVPHREIAKRLGYNADSVRVTIRKILMGRYSVDPVEAARAEAEAAAPVRIALAPELGIRTYSVSRWLANMEGENYTQISLPFVGILAHQYQPEARA